MLGQQHNNCITFKTYCNFKFVP